MSPCPPLLHNHISSSRERKRASRRHVVGNILERALLNLWDDPDYVAFRDRVQGFAFPPCTFCGGVKCSMRIHNKIVWGMGSRHAELAYVLKESSNALENVSWIADWARRERWNWEARLTQPIQDD